ncbi:MAG: DUF2586 family protein [Rikenellaceae bacterium]
MAKLMFNILAGGLGRTSASTDTHAGLLFAGNTALGAAVQTLTATGQVVLNDAATDAQKAECTFAIAEFFRLNNSGVLYVCGCAGVEASDITAALESLSVKYVGLIGVQGALGLSSTTEATAMVKELDTWAKERAATYAEFFRVVLAPSGGVGFSVSELDFSEVEYERVMFVASYDGANNMCGTMLGQLGAYPVHQKPSWAAHRIDSAEQWAELTLLDEEALPATATADTLLAEQGLCYAGYYARLAGTYWKNSRMCVPTTNDFAIITHCRVIDKAMGLLYDTYIQRLDAPLYVDAATGLLAAEDIAELQAKGYTALTAAMIAGKSGDDVELGIDSATGALPQDTIFINPDQNVLSTETLNVQVSLVPVGSSSNIVINIGLSNPTIA